MSSPRTIRDVDRERKTAIELVTELTGSPPTDAVRDGSDSGIAKTRSERDRAAWMASAKKGIADDARHLEQNGPGLAQLRRG